MHRELLAQIPVSGEARTGTQEVHLQSPSKHLRLSLPTIIQKFWKNLSTEKRFSNLPQSDYLESRRD